MDFAISSENGRILFQENRVKYNAQTLRLHMATMSIYWYTSFHRTDYTCEFEDWNYQSIKFIQSDIHLNKNDTSISPLQMCTDSNRVKVIFMY